VVSPYVCGRMGVVVHACMVPTTHLALSIGIISVERLLMFRSVLRCLKVSAFLTTFLYGTKTLLLAKPKNQPRTSADDGWLYDGMQNTDIGLAPLVVVCPVHYVRDGTVWTQHKMRSGSSKPRPAESGRAGPGRILGYRAEFLRAWPGLRPDHYYYMFIL